MRCIKSSVLALTVLFSITPLLTAEESTPSPSPTPAPAAPAAEKEGKHEKTELEDRMSEMSSSYKRLRRQIADPEKNASSLELVGKLRATAEKAAKLTPARTADLPEAERAKFVADYQNEMRHLVSELTRVEESLKANDNEAAGARLRDIGALQRKDHKTFQRPES